MTNNEKILKIVEYALKTNSVQHLEWLAGYFEKKVFYEKMADDFLEKMAIKNQD